MSPPSALPAHLLHLITLHTLSQEGFHSSHSNASTALADVLGRYISLLASKSGDYAAASGRTSFGVLDAIEALDELGLGMDDLDEFATDSRGRGTIGATAQLKEYLAEGREVDTSDYRRCTFVDVPPQHLPQLLEREQQPFSSPLQSSTKLESADEDEDSLSNAGSASDTSAGSTSFSLAFTEDSPAVETPQALGAWKEAYGHERDGLVRRMGKGVDREEYGGELPPPLEDEDVEQGDDDLLFGRITTFLPPLPTMDPMPPPLLSLPVLIDVPPSSPSSRNETPRATSLAPERAPLLLPGSRDERSTSTPAQPSYLLPTPFQVSADPLILPTPSTSFTSLLPPLPNPHHPSTSTLPSLIATNAALQNLTPTSLSQRGGKRLNAALTFAHRTADAFTSSNSIFGAIPVPTPRHSHIVPSEPTDPHILLPPRTFPVAGLAHPSGAMAPATPHRYPSVLPLGLAVLTHTQPTLLRRTMRMSQPGVLQDERGERLFYGGGASVTGVVEGPPDKKPGEEVWNEAEWGPEDENEKNRVVAKEVQVEVRATWDTPIRNWADPDLPIEKRRRI